ncbi:hypothetical protein [Tychonema sp. LEGE 07203]|uniref:hypothetical protein n=1 Tax=Tychonema sp. LEGE 07203 TaxID=1828671 RepID=UPI001880A7EE|nr:hypothetical protein [Tychonema sp. LEGE 07203]MBE9095621.1 hypothetical protein [Tychonema sp. LEGE 07203]
MQSIKVRSRVGSDGMLHLQIPGGIKDTELEVIVVFQPVTPTTEPKTPEDLGWPPGFFETVIGSWEGEPLVRPEQLEYEIREELL